MLSRHKSLLLNGLSLFLLTFVGAGAAHAQTQTSSEPPAETAPAAQSGSAVSLPTIRVESRRRQRAPQPGPAVEAAPATGTGERGTGPVQGVVAKQSVTGTKTDTPILETPQSIAVVTRDQIASQGAQSMPQALRYTPGVIFETYGASSQSNDIKVRGFLAPRYLDGLRVPVDTVITFAQPRIDPWMLERIEVLKGPSSGLYGETSPGGLVNMVSKQPTTERQNQIELQTGSFNRKQAAFDFSGPANKEKTFLYRIVGLGRDTDTVIDYTYEQRGLIAPSFILLPTADTKFTFLSSFQRDKGDGQPQQYVPGYGSLLPNANGKIPYSRNLGEPAFDHWKINQDMVGYSFEHRFNSTFQFRQNLRWSSVSNDLTSLRSEVAFPNMTTTTRNAFAIQSAARNFAVDNQLQSDFRTGPLQHTLLVGLDYQKQHSEAAFTGGFGGTLNIFNPVYGQFIPNVSTFFPITNQTSDQSQLGVYIQDQIKYDRWNLTLTGRRDHWQATTLNKLDNTTTDQTNESTTGRVGLSYVFDSGLAPYVSYSTSFEPVTGLTRAGAGNTVFQPTTGEGKEFGVKFQPLGFNALFTAAVFEIKKNNILTPGPDPLFSIQAGQVTTRGFEFDARVSLTDRLDIIAGYTHLEPIVTSSTEGNVGKDLVNTPRDYASIWANYTFRDGKAAGFGMGAGVRYIGSSFMDAMNTVSVSGYTLVDAMASYDFSYLDPKLTGLKLQANVNNLFDTYYVPTCFTSLAYCALGAPRTVLLTLKYAWK